MSSHMLHSQCNHKLIKIYGTFKVGKGHVHKILNSAHMAEPIATWHNRSHRHTNTLYMKTFPKVSFWSKLQALKVTSSKFNISLFGTLWKKYRYPVCMETLFTNLTPLCHIYVEGFVHQLWHMTGFQLFWVMVPIWDRRSLQDQHRSAIYMYIKYTCIHIGQIWYQATKPTYSSSG